MNTPLSEKQKSDLPEQRTLVHGNFIPREHLIGRGSSTEYQFWKATLKAFGIWDELTARAKESTNESLDFADSVLDPIRDRAVAQGRALHRDVSLEQWDRTAAIMHKAMIRFLSDLQDRSAGRNVLRPLFATSSRTEDVEISDEMIHFLSEQLCATDSGKAELRRLIMLGPESNRSSLESSMWAEPASIMEVVASVMRHAIFGEGEKVRLRMSGELRAEIRTRLIEGKFDLLHVLGGISGYLTQYATAIRDQPTLFIAGEAPDYLGKHLPLTTKIVHPDPAINDLDTLLSEHGVPGLPNFVAAFDRRHPFHFPDEIVDVARRLLAGGDSPAVPLDVILAAQGSPPGFAGIPLERLREIGAAHDLIVLTGMQSLKSHQEILDYIAGIDALAATKTPIGLEYSEPNKQGKAIEGDIIRALRLCPSIQMMAFNTAEARGCIIRFEEFSKANKNALGLPQLLRDQIDAMAKSLNRYENGRFGSESENPAFIYDSARLLKQLFDVPVLRVRGKFADVTLIDSDLPQSYVPTVREALFVSRMQAAIKVALKGDNIRSPGDQFRIYALPTGEALAALNALREHIGMHLVRAVPDVPSTTRPLVENWHLRMPSDQGYDVFAAYPVYFNIPGRTVSAGDTIAYATMRGMLPALRHLSGWYDFHGVDLPHS